MSRRFLQDHDDTETHNDTDKDHEDEFHDEDEFFDDDFHDSDEHHDDTEWGDDEFQHEEDTGFEFDTSGDLGEVDDVPFEDTTTNVTSIEESSTDVAGSSDKDTTEKVLGSGSATKPKNPKEYDPDTERPPITDNRFGVTEIIATKTATVKGS